MKTTEMLMCAGCLVLVLAIVFGDPSPAWRPQGRFGKRTRPMPRVIAGADRTDEGISTLLEVPVELLFTPSDLGQMKRKPWLCSNSGISGYPSCGGVAKRFSSFGSSPSSSSRVENLKTLADYLRL